MIGIFYNKSTLKNTLLLNINDHDPVYIEKNSEFSFGTDINKKMCFINIFNFSKHVKITEGFVKPTVELINTFEKIIKINLNNINIQNNFVVVKIIQSDPIKNTHLHMCKVFDGTNVYEVICGAANVKTNLVTVFAKDNSILPIGKRIKKNKLLGYDSSGMLCSAKELNIFSNKFNSSGIIELQNDFVIGESFDLIFDR